MLTRILILVSLVLTAASGCSGGRYTEFKAVLERSEVRVRAGGTGHLILHLEIPAGEHIYGNPKGPGTGKPTEITARSGNSIIFGTARFLPAKKYIGPGEKDFVWIYSDETQVVVPFSVRENTALGEYPVEVVCEALLCSESTCTLRIMTAAGTIRVVASSAEADFIPVEKLEKFSTGSDAKPAGSISSRKPASSDKIPVSFKPRFVSAADVAGILQAVLYGILAGIILNFMPCVLPVVSLKILGFVRHAHGSRKTLICLSLLFSLGILTSFAILASLASFLGYNWGELFQNRFFLVSMIALVYALSLSMFGVYTINIPSFASRASREKDNPYVDSYVKGLLATLLATPCSGPFLGGTLAFTFTQKPPVIFIIFMSIGAGMALPYLLLAFSPRLMRIIPKPGPWMITFEHIMAFMLAATSVYLIGILQAGLIIPTLWFLVIITIGLWQYGRFGMPDRPRINRIASGIALGAIIIGGYLIAFSLPGTDKAPGGGSTAREFSMKNLMASRDDGKISIVNFTADWCPNCKLVEKTSLHTRKVEELLKTRSVDFYTADLTRENPGARELLLALGSRSIPFLAVFPPGEDFSRPICLRDIYSRGDVVAAITEAFKGANDSTTGPDTIRLNRP